MIIPLKHRVDFAKIIILMSEDYNDDMPRSLRHSTYDVVSDSVHKAGPLC